MYRNDNETNPTILLCVIYTLCLVGGLFVAALILKQGGPIDLSGWPG